MNKIIDMKKTFDAVERSQSYNDPIKQLGVVDNPLISATPETITIYRFH